VPVAKQQLLAQSVPCLGRAPRCTVGPLPNVLTFHAYPTPPQGDRVLVAVTEGRTAAGEFEVTAAAWKRVRRCLTPSPAVRIRDYPA
jgi:hypothetical protein